MSPTTQTEDFACRLGAESTRFEDAQEALPLSRKASTTGKKGHGFRAGVGLKNVARRTLGIIMLLTTVLLWTTSNFLASVSQRVPAYLEHKLTLLAVYLRGQHVLQTLLCHLPQRLVLRPFATRHSFEARIPRRSSQVMADLLLRMAKTPATIWT